MKRLAFCFILVFSLVSFSSCNREPSAKDLLSDYCVALGIDGLIYSPEIKEGRDGYITHELFSDIYLFYGEVPKNYAVMLNSRTDMSAECGVFVSSNAATLTVFEEMCRERLNVLGAAEEGVIIRSSCSVFYSTFQDSEKTREIWSTIIRSHT